MLPILGKTMFSVADAAYSCGDVLIASKLWGDWDAVECEAREGLACMQHLRVATIPRFDEEVQRAASAFRYERDLIAADDMLAWLARWDLTQPQWMDYLRRAVQRGAWHAELPGILAAHAPTDAAVAEAMWLTLICGGHLARLTRKFAGRAAAWHRLTHDSGFAVECDASGFEAQVEVERARIPSGLAWPGLGALGPVVLSERATIVATLEVGLRRFQQMIETPGALSHEVDAHHLDWIRVEYGVLHFPTETAAREAFCCVRDDGLDLADLASTAHTPLRTARCYLDDVSGPLRDQFLAARPGEVLGPLRENGGFTLYRVGAKHLPSADDPDVRRRAEQSALRRALAHELNDRVRWHMLL